MMAVSKAKLFANRLNALTDKKGINGADLVFETSKAAGTKIGRHRITQITSGESLPTATEVAALATVLGVTVETLLEGIHELPEPKRRRYTATSTGESREVVFARNLNNALNEKGWRQSELQEAAERLMPNGVPLGKHLISNYARAQNIPNGARLNAIAKALGKKPEDLLPAIQPRFVGEDVDQTLSANISGDTARLRINMECPAEVAMEVLALLRPHKAR
jgi:transcriptional regulator with XRE-family HTH domain